MEATPPPRHPFRKRRQSRRETSKPPQAAKPPRSAKSKPPRSAKSKSPRSAKSKPPRSAKSKSPRRAQESPRAWCAPAGETAAVGRGYRARTCPVLLAPRAREALEKYQEDELLLLYRGTPRIAAELAAGPSFAKDAAHGSGVWLHSAFEAAAPYSGNSSDGGVISYKVPARSCKEVTSSSTFLCARPELLFPVLARTEIQTLTGRPALKRSAPATVFVDLDPSLSKTSNQ